MSPMALAASTPSAHWGVAAGADGDNSHVSRLPVCAHLAGEEFVEAVVVGDAGNGSDVRGERNGREGVRSRL